MVICYPNGQITVLLAYVSRLPCSPNWNTAATSIDVITAVTGKALIPYPNNVVAQIRARFTKIYYLLILAQIRLPPTSFREYILKKVVFLSFDVIKYYNFCSRMAECSRDLNSMDNVAFVTPRNTIVVILYK